LLRDMPDRHLLFCLTRPHGVLTMMASTHDLLKIVRQTESRENHWRIPSHNPLSKSSAKAIVMAMAR
jgi:hypothetical protein